MKKNDLQFFWKVEKIGKRLGKVEKGSNQLFPIFFQLFPTFQKNCKSTFFQLFLTFFILDDKISRSAKFWFPIQNLNLVAVWEIPYLNWRYGFVRFLRNFCQNAWTSSLCTHLKMMVFVSTQWSCEHERHKCRFITSIREYLPYWRFWLAYFSLQ